MKMGVANKLSLVAFADDEVGFVKTGRRGKGEMGEGTTAEMGNCNACKACGESRQVREQMHGEFKG